LYKKALNFTLWNDDYAVGGLPMSCIHVDVGPMYILLAESLVKHMP